jgi:UDP-N-acetylmuramoylalanine--D-glutamate ligase
VASAAAGIEVVGEVELAWRLRPAERGPVARGEPARTARPPPSGCWPASCRRPAGAPVAAGNVGLPLLDAVLAEQPYDVLAVELSSFQLHWSTGVRPHTAVVLNVAPDHVDWHGSLQAYAEAKGRIHAPGTVAVYNREDEASVRLARAAEQRGSARAASRWAARPPARLGVVEDLLVDGPSRTSPGRPPRWPCWPTCR